MSIRDSTVDGRRGVMQAFEGMLKPEEIEVISIVFSHASLRPARR